MPKSRSRSRKGARPSPEALRRLTRSRIHRRLGVLTVLVVLAAAVGWFWWQSRADEAAFAVLAEAGKAALGRVDSPPGRGGGHLTPGQSVRYGDRFPTSGIHDPEWVTPGFYTEAQSLTRLVHALEHGNVVVSYDRPGDAAIATLRMWTRLFGFEWGGVIAVPAPGLAEAVVLTAWGKRLRLETFDARAAAAFVDAYRGRGPEKPIR